jgi:hypothetical protein
MFDELDFDYDFLNDGYAAGLAGLAVGCIFFIPAAVLFGQKPVYLLSTFALLLVNI